MGERLKDLLLKIWFAVSIFFIGSVIIYIFFFIFVNGGKNISADFIFDIPKGFPLGKEGGIFPAIVGSFYLTLIACIFASILAIATSLYIVFYCKNTKLANAIYVIVQCIAGIPSIVLGLFGYTLLVLNLGLGRSLISGGITLGIMIFPFIEVRIEKILKEIDKDLIHSSYALGIPKYYTFLKLILPIYKEDIISTITLAGGFAMGATAPIIFTGAVISAPLPQSVFSPVMALPYHLYILIGEGISLENAYKTAFVMMIFLLLINLLSMSFVFFRKEK